LKRLGGGGKGGRSGRDFRKQGREKKKKKKKISTSCRVLLVAKWGHPKRQSLKEK